MLDIWEMIALGIVSFLLVMLIISTVKEIIHRRKNKRKQPQDHYFVERKKRDG